MTDRTPAANSPRARSRSNRVLLGLAVLALSGCAAFERRAPDPHKSISHLERVTLGGLPQTIRIRGDDRAANPILLFAHGGPGLPEMPVAHRNAELERIFTVVQWDQRGAGKSFRFNTPDMRAKRFVSDTLELSRALKRRFGARKIYLAGYSWGSLIAVRAVARAPDLFAAYIGISQVVNIPEAERSLYSGALAEARRRRLDVAISGLERIGPPPWKTSADKKLAKHWWNEFEGPVPNKMTPARFTALACTSPVYTPLDLVKTSLGAKISYNRLEGDIYAANLFREVSVWFLIGRHDTVVSSVIVERYFRTLHAPLGKRLIWFEKSGHAPHLEEPEKYRAIMQDVRDSVE